MQISWAARTDAGLRRSQNEDTYGADSELGLFVVADGMGGHAGGEVASQLAVAEIRDVIAATADLGPDDTWPTAFDRQVGTAGNRLRAGFDAANRRIAQQADGAESLRGMATTAVAVLVTAAQAAVAHVGDSRAYLSRGGQLSRLTSDHSWVEEQMRAGMMTETAAREHPWRNIVTRALSGAGALEVELTEIALQGGDRILLCSDGLSAVIHDSEIERVVCTTEDLQACTIEDLQAVCDELVHQANAAGGPDNVTVLLLDVGSDAG